MRGGEVECMVEERMWKEWVGRSGSSLSSEGGVKLGESGMVEVEDAKDRLGAWEWWRW